LLRVEQPGAIEGVGRYAPVPDLPLERGAWVVTLTNESQAVQLRSSQ
jgi:hypothetical protein